MIKKNKIEITEDVADAVLPERTCFVIMPISDNDKYTPGHFGRVYEHIIKPACILAGFTPLRADEVKTTNLIALDIVKQIIDSDMAICDLSSQNPNVLYEVGIRQAFNRPVTFIKDLVTKRIFDIQGFRDILYDETLRIDTVQKTIEDLAEIMNNTYENKEEVNSLVTLLGITAASVSSTPISKDTEIILQSMKSIESRMSQFERRSVIGTGGSGGSGGSAHLPPIHVPENAILLSPAAVKELKSGEYTFTRKYGPAVVRTSAYESGSPDTIIVQLKTGQVRQLNVRLNKFYHIPLPK